MNSHASRGGLTVPGLLAIIAMIVILLGLLFPMLNRGVSEKPGRARARSDIQGIVAAVKQYYTEYGHYPPMANSSAVLIPDGGEAGPDQFVGDLSESKVKIENSMLMNTLRSIDAPPNEKFVSNPKRIIFLEVKAVGNPAKPKGGILEKVKAGQGATPGMPVSDGCFLDPWGRQYFIMIDTNNDDLLDVGQIYGDFTDPDRPHTAVGVWSMGADNVTGTGKNPSVYRSKSGVSDDLISWQ